MSFSMLDIKVKLPETQHCRRQVAREGGDDAGMADIDQVEDRGVTGDVDTPESMGAKWNAHRAGFDSESCSDRLQHRLLARPAAKKAWQDVVIRQGQDGSGLIGRERALNQLFEVFERHWIFRINPDSSGCCDRKNRATPAMREVECQGDRAPGRQGRFPLWSRDEPDLPRIEIEIATEHVTHEQPGLGVPAAVGVEPEFECVLPFVPAQNRQIGGRRRLEAHRPNLDFTSRERKFHDDRRFSQRDGAVKRFSWYIAKYSTLGCGSVPEKGGPMSQTSAVSPRRVDRRTMICTALRQSSLVEVHEEDSRLVPNAELRCVRCGISVRVPHVSFDLAQVCSICRSFERNRERVGRYFGMPKALKSKLSGAAEAAGGSHDCVVLFSGGKDSTYMLFRLIEMGLSVMTLTLDNGFISSGAIANIDSVVRSLGIEHITLRPGSFETVINESIDRHATPCKGCFKGLLDGALTVAGERRIPFIVTGLSRGQIVEERLQWFYDRNLFDPDEIDAQLSVGRGVYHQKEHFRGNPYWRSDLGILAERVALIDYYRFDPVRRDEIITLLRSRPDIWTQPADCGFCSTNCLVNDIGIGLHKARTGWHNYEIATAWDVRLGHLNREEATEDLKDVTDSERFAAVLQTLGRSPATEQRRQAETIVCRIGAHISDVQVASMLDDAMPGWRSEFRLEYSQHVVQSSADRVVATPLGRRLAKRDPVRPVTAETAAGLPPIEQVVLAVPQDLAANAKKTFSAMLLDHRWACGGSVRLRDGAAFAIPAFHEVSLQSIAGNGHLAALDKVLDRMAVAAREQPGRLQVMLCRRGQAVPAWIALVRTTDDATWNRWRALIADSVTRMTSGILEASIGEKFSGGEAGGSDDERPLPTADTAAVHNLQGSACFDIDVAERICWRQAPKQIRARVGAGEDTTRRLISSARVEILDDLEGRAMMLPDLEAKLASVLPPSVTRLGIRIVGPDHARLPDMPGASYLFDPCGRWATVAGALQLIVEAGGRHPVAVVHADGDIEQAVRSARHVVTLLTEALR